MIPNFVKQREQRNEGFDLYFAGTQNNDAEMWMLTNHSCRLQSQVNDRSNIRRWVNTPDRGKLFIDSGAYTAFTKGRVVDVDEYISYINSISSTLYCFAQVDHITGKGETKEDTARLSWENFLYMRTRVSEPHKLVPIFHQGEDLKWLQNMLEYSDNIGKLDYIGFGAMVGTGVTREDKCLFFDRAFSIIEKSSNPDVKIHAMGMTSLSLLELYPFYSADSTSWIMQAATGSIFTPWGLIDVSDKNRFLKTSPLNSSPMFMEHLCNWLRYIGFTLEEVMDSYRPRTICNLIALTDWAKNYKYKGGKRIIKKSLF